MVVDCEVPELLGGVEVLDEAVPEVEGVVEGGVCVVLGAEDCVLGVAHGVVGAVAMSETVGSAGFDFGGFRCGFGSLLLNLLLDRSGSRSHGSWCR